MIISVNKRQRRFSKPNLNLMPLVTFYDSLPTEQQLQQQLQQQRDDDSEAPKRFKALSSGTVLLLRDADGASGIGLSRMHPLSTILRARFDGKTYLAESPYWNPGLFDVGGACIEPRATGVGLLFLLDAFLGRSDATRIPLRSNPSEWRAWFDLTRFAPADGVLVVRLHFASPLASTSAFYEQDVTFHAFEKRV
jgi:hypothetical protein